MAKLLTHHPHADNSEDLGAEAHAIVRTGKALLSCGAETYRVRLSMEQVAAAVGIQWLQSHVTLSELTVTLFKGARFRTQVGNVHSVGVNADKMTELERMTQELQSGATPADVEARLDAIDAREKLYPSWLTALVACLACAAVSFLNNAWALEIVGVAIGSFLGQFARSELLKRHINVYLSTMISALIAALLYIGVTTGLAAVTGSSSNYAAGFVPVLIYLVPGFPLVNSLMDLVKTDITAGLSRLAYAFMILASSATALLVVTWVAGATPAPLDPAPVARWLWWILAVIASFVGVTGWAIMFNLRLRGSVLAGVCGIFGSMARLVLLEFHAPPWLAALVGCFIIGILAVGLARWQKLADATLCIPATLIMVPGVVAYRTLVYFSSGDSAAFIANASLAIFTILGMAIGLSVARILSDKEWIRDRRRGLGD